jgi:hypothetical protein
MQPVLFEPRNLGTVVIKDKGTQVAEGLLMGQYQYSVNFKEYLGAFVGEMDYLYEQTERVYLGRTLEYAIGHQLDVIGAILGQKRSVELPGIYFGFQGASGVAAMADEATPSIGGVFLSEESEGFEIIPLEDLIYKRLLLAKAFCSTRETMDLNGTYWVISTLLYRVPSRMSLTFPSPREILLNLPADEVSASDVQLILYLSEYFIPTGSVFNIVLF